MIVFYGQGGLGNQLFQYAAARRLASKHGCTPVLDPYWFNNPKAGETVRSLELSHYPLMLRVASAAEQRRWRLLHSRFARYISPLHPLTLVRERGFGVNQAALSATANSYLFGYWQSEAYFADIRRELLRELTPRVTPTTADQAIIDLIQKSNAVSVHVRRGDYVTLSTASAYHGLCSLDYYHGAIQTIAAKVINPTLFIFSDDPDWTRENLMTQYPTYYVNHNGPADAFQDLRLMSLCKHHVIANSSFSWWGAWLGEQPTSIVIAPARWYAKEHPTPDLIPKRWLKI